MTDDESPELHDGLDLEVRLEVLRQLVVIALFPPLGDRAVRLRSIADEHLAGRPCQVVPPMSEATARRVADELAKELRRLADVIERCTVIGAPAGPVERAH